MAASLRIQIGGHSRQGQQPLFSAFYIALLLLLATGVGQAQAPEINLVGNGNPIANNSFSPSTVNDTDFGSSVFGSGAVEKTYTIENLLGTGPLNLTGTPALVSLFSTDFSVTAQPTTPIAGGSSTTFKIRFNPTSPGAKSAYVSISNNDSDEGTYLFQIQASSCVSNPVVTTTANTGAGSLREAITNVCPDGTITFDPTVFSTPQTISLSSSLSINKNLTISGPGADKVTINQTGSNAAVFFIQGGNISISGLKITGGSSSGVFNSGGTVTLTNCELSGNTSVFGNSAAAYNSDQIGASVIPGIMALNGCYIHDNLKGGVANFGTQLTVTNCQIVNNAVPSFGGGINSHSGTLIVTNSTISGNTCTSGGGGISVGSSSSATITNTKILNNQANNNSNGGGIQATSLSTPTTITDCTIEGNTAAQWGGGIYSAGETTVISSTIANNTAQGGEGGGGIFGSSGGTLTLTNSTISGNHATSTSNGARGGGLRAATTTEITGCTITGNDADGTGSTYSAGGIIITVSSVTIKNTIIAGNIGTNGANKDVKEVPGTTPNPVISDGYNLIGDGTGATGFTGTADQVGTSGSPINALLGPLADNGGLTKTHALRSGSPAIDQGNAFGLTTDQRGVERPQDDPSRASADDGTDIGAVERVCVSNPVVTTTADSGAGSLRDAIDNACPGATITFASPLFDAAQTITLTSGDLVIYNNLIIEGPGADLLTVSGNNQSRVFTVNLPDNSTTVTISGLTVTGGNGTSSLSSYNGDGGGIMLKRGNLTLLNAIVSGNTATITTSANGGGIANQGNGLSPLTLTNCIINGNDTNRSGGGIFNLGGPMTVSNSTISNNRAGLQNNRGGLGGGIENYYPMTLTNCTISGNSVADRGDAGFDAGGVYTPTGTSSLPSQIISCTITNNTAAGSNSTGGLRLDYDDGGSITVSNTIIAGNTGTSNATADINSTSTNSNSIVVFTSGGYNLIGDGTGGSGFTHNTNNDLVGTSGSPINALLGPLANNGGPTPTHALLIGSPAIENGNAFGVTTDQRGVDRPQDDPLLANAADGTDIGAVEMACPPPTAFTLIGGGRSCDNGVSITLSGSELGVTYQLMKYGDDIGGPVEGTGDVLDFGYNFTEAGIYTVEARRTAWPCPADMTGCVIITPCFSGLGAAYCADDPTPHILTGSDAPNGTFEGPGITDNGDGTATFTPSLAGTGGAVTYTVGNTSNRPGQLTATTGNKSADAGGSVSTSQNVAVYLCGAPPSFTGLNATYCDLDESVTLTGNYAPLGFFTGPGITDNGDGTATFNPSAAVGTGDVRYLLTTNLDKAWSSMSAGYSHSMAIKTDGSLWAWGYNLDGQFGNGTNTNSDIPVQIDAATNWASVSAGGYHTLALKTDGTLWAWGYNSTGVLGNGTNTDSNVPVQIGTDADWASISAGPYHSMAMKTDGTIWTWGDNFLGQLGNGTNGLNTGSNTPMQVGADADWASIAAGDFHSMATKTDGSLWAWGRNTTGQLGDGTNTNSNVPIQVGTDTDWNKAVGGAKHSLATKTNGTLWAWGNNEYGQIGNGSNTDSNIPVQVGTDTDWAGISACSTSVALKTNGTLWAWGDNQYGQIGNGNNTNSNTPVQVGADADWASAEVSLGGFTLGLKTNGTLQTWGYNAEGELGNGTKADSNIPTKVVTAAAITAVTVNICLDFTGLDATYCAGAEPVTLTGNHAPDGTFSGPGITDNGDGTASFDPAAAGTGGSITYTYGDAWTSASAGGYHGMAVQANGSLWGWGNNEDYGQLGDGTFDDRYVPVLSGNGTNDWAKVSAGYEHSLGLKTDGTLWAWGYGYDGELGNGANDDSNVPVQVGTDTDWAFIKAGNYVSYGIKTNGTLWAWGYGDYDLFGDGTTADRNTPVQIGIDTDWASVSNHSQGGDHTLAIKTNGTLWAWGNNDFGRFGDGTTNASAIPVQIGIDDNWVSADAGIYHSLGLKTDGTLWAWGYGGTGELGNGATNNSLVPIKVGIETNWASAAAGQDCSLAIKTDGTLWSWGYNFNGQLGNGTNDDSLVPVQSGTATNWASVWASYQGFVLGLQTDGSLWSWGYQEYGELGDGLADVNSNVPVLIGTPPVAFRKNVAVLASPTGLAISNISASDCKNTTCATDDTYTADVTVTFNTQPLSGTVSLSGDDLVGTAPSVDASTIVGTSHTFTGVTLRADGKDIDLTATLGDCSESASLGKAPRCFFEPHVPTDIVVNSSGCSSINGTFVPNGTFNGAPAWIDPVNSNYINWSGTAWVIGIFHVNTSGSITELPCSTGWGDGPPCGTLSLSGGCGSLAGTPITPPCDITNISIANASACTNPGNTTDAADDYFTADVTVTFAYAPENKNLVLSQGGNQLASVSSDDLLCTTTWTFTGVQMPANGQDVVLTAAFEESTNKPAPGGDATAARDASDCSYTSGVLMSAPAACSCVPPTFTLCPTNKTANTSANGCAALVDYIATAGGTPASAITYAFEGATAAAPGSSGTGSSSSFNKGVTTVTLKATNDCGAPTCSFTVTVTDNVPPAIICPGNVAVSVAPDQCGNNATWTAPVGTDNCTGANTFSTHTPGGFFAKGQTTVTYTVTDGASLTSACSFTVTVGDNQNPSITCPGNITKSTDPGQCTAVVTYASPTFSDNCPGAYLTLTSAANTASGSAFAKGTTMVNWKATDASGNSSAVCGFTVTVSDTQAPSITCPANVVRSNDAGQCYAVVTYATPTALDNCGMVTVARTSAANTASGAQFPAGVTTPVTWEASDAANPANKKSCTFTVKVNDTQSPTITCPANLSKNTDPNACTAVVTYTSPAYADNCTGGGAAIEIGLSSGQPFPKGITIVRWKATDGSGLTKTCSFRVTVNDTQAPTVACPPSQSVSTTPTSCVSAPLSYDTPTAADNCTPAPTVAKVSGLSSGSAFPRGANAVDWRATDGAGNTKTCSFTVTVTDEVPPTITCPPNLTASGSGSPCKATVTYAMPTASDNCSGTLNPALISGLGSGSAFPAGTTTNIWRATASGAQTADCFFTVTVSCPTAPGGEQGAARSAAAESRAPSRPPMTLSLSPNPATAQTLVTVEGLGDTDCDLTVFDARGRVVWQQAVVPAAGLAARSAVCTLPVADWATGLYFVTLRSEGAVATKRLVVSRQ